MIPGTKRLFVRVYRGISEHLYLTGVGTGVIAAATLLIGAFALVLTNLEAFVSSWNQDAHVSAYFRSDTPKDAQAITQQAVMARPEVKSVEYVTSEQAASWMKEELPDLGPVLADLGPEVLPVSLEITLKDEYLTTEKVALFAQTLTDSKSFADVDYGRDWVGQFDTFLSVASGFGVILAVFTSLGTLFLVANTVQLAVYSRQDELEIMRLVGATSGYILSPFVIEGAIQGLIGGIIALVLLFFLHGGLEARLVAVVPEALLPTMSGQLALLPLPLKFQVLLLVGGVLGGAGVNGLAAWRFLSKLT